MRTNSNVIKSLKQLFVGEDQRILLVIGPCSSDNEEAVLEYAKRLSELQEEVKDRVFMVMRVYTAKPRTNGDGYKGLIHQPNAKEAPSLSMGSRRFVICTTVLFLKQE